MKTGKEYPLIMQRSKNINTEVNGLRQTHGDGAKIAVRYRSGQTDSLIVFIHGQVPAANHFLKPGIFLG